MSLSLCPKCVKKNFSLLGTMVYLPFGVTRTDAEDVKRARAAGARIGDIAAKFRISARRVHQILSGR